MHWFKHNIHLKVTECVMRSWEISYLRHDSNGRLSGGLGYLVLNEEEHVFIIEKSDEMEGAKAGSTAQGKVTNHHRAKYVNGKESKNKSNDHITVWGWGGGRGDESMSTLHVKL